MYGAVGENSIDFLKILYRLSENTGRTFSENSIDFLEKLYRLFPDTSVQRLGRNGSNICSYGRNAPLPSFSRSDSSVEKSANVHRSLDEGAQNWRCLCIV